MSLQRIRAVVVLLLAAAATAACGGGSSEPAGIPYRQFLVSVSPASGPTTGGTEVTLEGQGFREPDLPILGILIGDQSVASWQIVDDRTIRLITPPATVAGPATILLIGVDSPRLDGGVLARSFTYVPPTTLQRLGLGPR